jgi:hypothetical protein
MNLRTRISAPNIVAGVVLGLVLGGGAAYAANEFTGKNIKNGTLTGADIKNNSLTSVDVKNASLKGLDVKDESLSSLDILNASITGDDVSDGSLTGADITDNSINGDDVAQLHGDIDIIDNTISTFDIATDAVDSDEVLDFGLTNQDVGVLFAQVAADGTADNSSGGVTTIKLGVGTYEVDFGRDISPCAFTATIGGATTTTASGQINVADRAGNVEAVFVDTNDTAGAGADRPFHLIVVC